MPMLCRAGAVRVFEPAPCHLSARGPCGVLIVRGCSFFRHKGGRVILKNVAASADYTVTYAHLSPVRARRLFFSTMPGNPGLRKKSAWRSLKQADNVSSRLLSIYHACGVSGGGNNADNAHAAGADRALLGAHSALSASARRLGG